MCGRLVSTSITLRQEDEPENNPESPRIRSDPSRPLESLHRLVLGDNEICLKRDPLSCPSRTPRLRSVSSQRLSRRFLGRPFWRPKSLLISSVQEARAFAAGPQGLQPPQIAIVAATRQSLCHRQKSRDSAALPDGMILTPGWWSGGNFAFADAGRNVWNFLEHSKILLASANR
jgi:hypothetical protein